MRRAVIALLLCALPAATAEAVGRESPFDKIKKAVVGKNHPVERNSFLSIAVGTGFGQEYTRDLQFALSYKYHLSPYFGLGFTALGGLSFESALVDEIRTVRPGSLNAVRPDTMFGAFTVDVHLVPLYGKFVIFGKYAVHYDLALTVGVGIAGVTGKQFDGQTSAARGTRGAFAPSFGASVRMLFSRHVGLGAEFRDYLWNESNPLTGESGLANHFSITLGPVFVF